MTRTLIFDLDGTISNPFAGNHNSVNYALSAFGHPRVPAAAHANGLDAIGVLWGFGSPAELTACGTRHIAATPAELLEILD